jgi:phospholipase/carboxylesterase
MAEILPAVEIDPPGRPEGVVVWLHGLGADGHDFEPIVPVLGLPRARFVFPHAPSTPVTINGGMVMPAWYDIVTIGGGGEKEADVRRSAAQIRALVEREEQKGVPADRIILAGFSQGAAMALHVGTRHPRALRGIMLLSGYEVLAPLREREETVANRATPMLFCHGTADPVVPIAAGRLAYEAHARPDRPAEWHEFPMGHEVSPSELTVIRQWLGARFGRAA